jgi:hypothetical protein
MCEAPTVHDRRWLSATPFPRSTQSASSARHEYNFVSTTARDTPCRVCRGLSPPSEHALPGAKKRGHDCVSQNNGVSWNFGYWLSAHWSCHTSLGVFLILTGDRVRNPRTPESVEVREGEWLWDDRLRAFRIVRTILWKAVLNANCFFIRPLPLLLIE